MRAGEPLAPEERRGLRSRSGLDRTVFVASARRFVAAVALPSSPVATGTRALALPI